MSPTGLIIIAVCAIGAVSTLCLVGMAIGSIFTRPKAIIKPTTSANIRAGGIEIGPVIEADWVQSTMPGIKLTVIKDGKRYSTIIRMETME